MNWRNYKTLIIGGGICLVLLLVGLFLLFSFSGKHASTQSDIDSGISHLKSLKGAPVFPSPANVKVLKENIDQLSRFRADYVQTISAGQINAESMSGTDFLRFYETIRGGLMSDGGKVDAASGKGEVTFPEYFGFGFEAYQKGGRPSDDAVPRLTVQLKTIDAICRLMFDAGVSEIKQVERNVFEIAGESDVPARRTPSIPETENPLFEEECFTFVAKGNESNIWNVVDSLASTALPVVVNKMSVKNDNTTLQPKFEQKDVEGVEGMDTPSRSSRSSRSTRGRARGEAVAKPKVEVGDRKVEAGNESVEATFELCVYRFNTETTAQTEGK